jgi:thiol-disulfide isomerase/thioredoxin/outer membrane protein assembly factor BamD (BamD/ComL family)
VTLLALFALCGGLLLAQEPSAAEPSTEEQQSLMQALSDGASSPLDAIRALEAHLKRYPNTSQKTEIQQMLAKAALESQDWERVVLYGEPLLKVIPDDVILLDRVSFGLLVREEKGAAARAADYASALATILEAKTVQPGYGAAKQQDDRDRALARALLFQSRARYLMGDLVEAVKSAEKAFTVYPNEEAAHEWAYALNHVKKPDEAIAKMAEAFAISDARVTDAGRLETRKQLGDWYRTLHGSEQGLGDLTLAAYDRMAAVTEARKIRLIAMDPNAGARAPLEFVLTGLDGKPFRMASLKGKVVVMDFWATWCVPCRVQHPMYQTLKQKFPANSGVVFLEVNADEERQVVEPFLEEEKWDKTVYFHDGLAQFLNVENIPATILLDKAGHLASRMDGFDPDKFLEQMTARIKAAVDQ